MLFLMKVKMAMLAGALTAPVLATALTPPASHRPPDARHLAPAMFQYRATGEYSRDRAPVQAPLRSLRLPADLTIMKRLVTVAEYEHCVTEAECASVAAINGPDDPVTGVNWHDASAYAAWLSRKTGMPYRLPTDEEWTFAAAEKAPDETLPPVDPADPAQAWIARYDAEASRAKPATASRSARTPGANSNGLDDLAGGVWEWTNSCFVRARIDDGGEQITNVNCGVRVVEGAHRSYMTDFIRDPKAGGCAVGIPPTALGFRLVVQPSQSLVSRTARNAAKLFMRS